MQAGKEGVNLRKH